HECSFFTRCCNSNHNDLLQIVAIHGGYLLFTSDTGAFAFLRSQLILQRNMSHCCQYLSRFFHDRCGAHLH
ncbi:MAG: hypothetical protein ACRDBQ_14105, partial [Shewanella sp.]